MNQDILSYGTFNDYNCLRKTWPMIPFIKEATSKQPSQMPSVKSLPGL